MLKAVDISKDYRGKKVLKNLDHEIINNKLIAYIGSNGAGKSTLLSILTRTLEKSSGDVFLHDLSIHKWNSKELSKKISILRQSNELNIRLTVYDLVSFGRYPYSKTNLTDVDRAFVDDAINYLGLSDIKDKFLDELSGGQRQMAYIAMVLAQDTNYIFLDEPLNNLDMRHSQKIMKTLKKLVEEKHKTVIIVIHDINFAVTYADYFVAMKNGQIIKEGSIDEVITNEILQQIFDVNIEVVTIKKKKVCLYYE